VPTGDRRRCWAWVVGLSGLGVTLDPCTHSTVVACRTPDDQRFREWIGDAALALDCLSALLALVGRRRPAYSAGAGVLAWPAEMAVNRPARCPAVPNAGYRSWTNAPGRDRRATDGPTIASSPKRSPAGSCRRLGCDRPAAHPCRRRAGVPDRSPVGLLQTWFPVIGHRKDPRNRDGFKDQRCLPNRQSRWTAEAGRSRRGTGQLA
jgi:hypothetical protein